METNPFRNTEDSLDKQIELQRTLLGNNSEEVVELITKKNPSQITEKAKLLLARIGKTSSMGFAYAGGVGVAGAYGAMAGGLIGNATGMITKQEFSNLHIPEIGAFLAVVMMVGVFGEDKFKEMIEKLESKT